MFLSPPFGFGGVAASLNGVPLQISGSVVDNIPPYNDAYAYVTLNPDGTGSTTRSFSSGVVVTPFQWYPKTDGIGQFYWVRFTNLGGDELNYGLAAGPTLHQLVVPRTIGFVRTGGQEGVVSADLKIDLFARADGGPVIDSTTIQIEDEFAF